AADPRLAILDEPVAGLAKPDRKDLVERIGMVCDEMGIAVLVTGQDFASITNLADFVYVLDSGTVVGTGEPSDVAADTRVQAAFLRGAQTLPAAPAAPPAAEPPPDRPPGPDGGPDPDQPFPPFGPEGLN